MTSLKKMMERAQRKLSRKAGKIRGDAFYLALIRYLRASGDASLAEELDDSPRMYDKPEIIVLEDGTRIEVVGDA